MGGTADRFSTIARARHARPQHIVTRMAVVDPGVDLAFTNSQQRMIVDPQLGAYEKVM